MSSATASYSLDPAAELDRRFAASIGQAAPSAAGQADAVVRRSRRADYQVNGVIAAAKASGARPADLARDVLARTDLSDMADDVSVADAGFINVNLDEKYLTQAVGRLRDDPRLGTRLADVTLIVVVDYSAPNVAKEMHVGHLRSTIIGDAIVRLLEREGHSVIRENHIGDWGTQFGMLIEHLADIGEAEATQELSVGDLTDFYRDARLKFDSDPEFADRARRRVVTLQSGDPKTVRLWRVLVDQSAAYFQRVYDLLGVKLSRDDMMGESAYNHLLPGIVPGLRAAGILIESDGAQCVFPPGFTGRDGSPLPLIVQKKDGGYGYAATDLATIRDRVDRLGASLMLYVIGAPQHLHLEMCYAVARMAGWLPPDCQAVHVGFGMMLGKDKRPFKTRAGESTKLVDLLDEAVAKAGRLVDEKSPHLAGDERHEVARAVGIGAIKYADLSVDRNRDYVFDWDRMLSFDGNTGPYLQYAHARARSVLRKSGEEHGSFCGQVHPAHPTERELCLDLLSYGTEVTEARDTYSPHRLCGYLYTLASDFTAFYEACPVLSAEPEIRASRLALTRLVADVLRDGLGLLGIETPERL